MKHISPYITFESMSTKRIKYIFENVDSYDGQYNMELGAYIDGTIVGMVEYVLYGGELTVSHIIVVPKYRRIGIGSRMIEKMKSNHPDYEYRPSLKTELGNVFKHKKVNDLGSIEVNESTETNILYHYIPSVVK